ncbi:Protein of unknown function [Catalinimonas alkaloidigena]|uniref:DUF2029 domain-containing protein n=1 Tax=Catalinimonas alkaloidigena TaxID=1075417 RepID=A0A1G9UAC5_9BACT|nr:Protein of unknown function [Catalinimonas alkaloidigena]
MLLGAYLLLGLLASIIQVLKPEATWGDSGYLYPQYNNWLIFRASFFHLIHHQALYELSLAEYADLFKYSPTFALSMGPLAWLPPAVGFFGWNLLNAGSLYWALSRLPLQQPAKARMLWFTLVELLTNLQNAQSNALIAALFIGSYVAYEHRNPTWAMLMIVANGFIKIFGIVSGALFLLYPQKGKALGWGLGWLLVLALLPLLVISPTELVNYYQQWGELLSRDHGGSYGFSVMGWLHSWFGWDAPKLGVLGVGIVLFLLPYARVQQYASPSFRLLLLASMMIWVIIFNHMAESPTFVIAVAGVAIWYFIRPRSKADLVLLVLVLVFTALSPTDLFPKFIKREFFRPYAIKAVPCILVWGKILYELMTEDFRKPQADESLSFSANR